MSNTPIALRTRQRGQIAFSNSIGPPSHQLLTSASQHSSPLTSKDASSFLMRLDQELPPLPTLGAGNSTPTLVSQLEEHVSRIPEAPEHFRDASEYRRCYEEVMGESPPSIREEEFRRIHNNWNMSVHDHSVTPHFSQTPLTLREPYFPTLGPSGIPHSTGPTPPNDLCSQGLSARSPEPDCPVRLPPYPSTHSSGT